MKRFRATATSVVSTTTNVEGGVEAMGSYLGFKIMMPFLHSKYLFRNLMSHKGGARVNRTSSKLIPLIIRRAIYLIFTYIADKGQ